MKHIRSGWGKVSLFALALVVGLVGLVGQAQAAVDPDDFTEPIMTEVTAITPKLLIFIGGVFAIFFAIGFLLKLASKAKRG